MAKKQTIQWTACPNGFEGSTGRQRLRISVFVSPRLETSLPFGTVGDYPDFCSGQSGVNWASVVEAMQFRVEMNLGRKLVTKSYAAKVASAHPEPALWDSFFYPAMPIKKYHFVDLSNVAMNSFSQKTVFNTVKTQYKTVASVPSLAYRVPDVKSLVKIPGVSVPPLVRVLPVALQRSAAIRSMAAPIPVQESAFTKFEAFHTPYEKSYEYVPPPVPEMDFHKAHTALGNYPALMHRLGFVVDLEVDFVGEMKDVTRLRVVPKWADSRGHTGALVGDVTHTDAMDWTAVTMKTGEVLIRAGSRKVKTRTVEKFFATSGRGQLREGYMIARSVSSADKDPVTIHNVDVDIAATRFLAAAAESADLMNRLADATNIVSGFSAAAGTSVSASSGNDQVALPALGQPVIRYAVNGLASKVQKQFEVFAQCQANLEEGKANIHHAEDITRGYRIDVWDDLTRQWHKLCDRVGTYRIGATPITWSSKPTLTDEGWVQLGGISAPENVESDTPPSEMRIHESVFDWSGWSLSVPRPGAALSEPDDQQQTHATKTFTGPDEQEYPIGHYPDSTLPLDVTFNILPSSLPRLRFGTTYRFRARAVDLCGNSVAFDPGKTNKDPGGAGDKDTRVTRAITHKRYDPVKPPDLVMGEAPKPSESPYIVVVRTYTDPAVGFARTEGAIRHVNPPRTSVSMAEAQGGLDDLAEPGKPMDTEMWTELCARDAYDAPKDVDGKQIWQPSVETPTPYLPDMYSRGVAFGGLPGAPNQVTMRTYGTSAMLSGVRITSPTSGGAPLTVSTMRVGFEQSGAPWYKRLPLSVTIAGVGPIDTRIASHDTPAEPVWNESTRVLGVELPQAEDITVEMSSFANPADLAVMGVYQWGVEKHLVRFAQPSTVFKRVAAFTGSAVKVPARANMIPVKVTASMARPVKEIINTALIGQNWMLTPKVNVNLVHAVDTPLITPEFSGGSHFERKAGETHATLVDWMPIHGKSTSKLDVKAKWTEPVDDPSDGPPKFGTAVAEVHPAAVSKAAHVLTLNVDRETTSVLNAGKTKPLMLTKPWGPVPSTPFIETASAKDFEPQRQFFGDTKHRYIEYTAIATTRFQRFFNDKTGLQFVATSPTKWMHVPSSARPAPPDIKYIMPTFGWQRSGSTSTRKGGGLRVYMGRPWFSSGENEQLAVVMYSAQPANLNFENLSPHVSHWGLDPLYVAPSLPSSGLEATATRFPTAKAFARGLVYPEAPATPVELAAFDVEYDSEKDLWFADIVIDPGKAYFPFIKLALARYQRYSLTRYELSKTVVADFVQLAPDRVATATVSSLSTADFGAAAPPPGTKLLTVTLVGQSYSDNYPDKLPAVTATIERKTAGSVVEGTSFQTGGAMGTPPGWSPLGEPITMEIVPRTIFQIALGITSTTWQAKTYLTNLTSEEDYRVVIRESEVFARYNGTTSPDSAERLVYAEAIPFHA